jgi:hypothetical protein
MHQLAAGEDVLIDEIDNAATQLGVISAAAGNAMIHE